MFPTEGNVFIAPFMDDTLYLEWMRKARFWCVLQWIQHSTYLQGIIFHRVYYTV